MLKALRTSLFVLSASFAFGQLDSNSVTVTASSTANIQPDQATFAVYVNSDVNATLSDVLAVLQPAGIGLSNFSGIGSVSTVAAAEQWAFGLSVPLSQIKATIAMLTGLQQNVPQANKNLSLSFSIQGTQVSQQAQQSQICSYADLLTSARSQAQALASAGGRTLSGVLAMSTGISTSTGTVSPLSSLYSATSQACSLKVKFALLGL